MLNRIDPFDSLRCDGLRIASRVRPLDTKTSRSPGNVCSGRVVPAGSIERFGWASVTTSPIFARSSGVAIGRLQSWRFTIWRVSISSRRARSVCAARALSCCTPKGSRGPRAGRHPEGAAARARSRVAGHAPAGFELNSSIVNDTLGPGAPELFEQRRPWIALLIAGDGVVGTERHHDRSTIVLYRQLRIRSTIPSIRTDGSGRGRRLWRSCRTRSCRSPGRRSVQSSEARPR